MMFWKKKKVEKEKKVKKLKILKIQLKDGNVLNIENSSKKDFDTFIKLMKERKDYLLYKNALIKRDEVLYIVRE